MSTLDDFEIILNPGADYFKSILKDMNNDEGWSFCNTDYDTWVSTYTKFWCYMARKKGKGTDVPIACVFLGLDEYSEISGEELYSVGNYYCRPEYRGSGIAMKLIDTIVPIVPKDANVTLNGVLKMAPKYAQRYGFTLMPLQLRFTYFYCNDVVQEVQRPSHIVIRDVREVPWTDIETYERSVNPRPHPKFLKRWIINQGTHTKIAYDLHDNPIGMCCLREDVVGDLCCGPFYAESRDASLALLAETLASIDLRKFRKVLMLHPKENNDAESVVSEICDGNYSSEDYYWSQFTKKVVEIPQNKIYSISDSTSGFI